MRRLALALAVTGMLSITPSATAAVTVAQSGWAWANPTPQGNTLQAIDFMDGRGYAVGAAGTVLRTDDVGATWSGSATGTSAPLDRLQIIDPDTIVVSGGDGCVLRRSDDGGKTFHKLFIVAEENCPTKVQAFRFVDKQSGYLLLRDGSVLLTHDGGLTFARQTDIPGTPASIGGGNDRAVELVFSGPATGIVFVSKAVGGPSVAYATTDEGISWKPLTTVEPGTVRRVYMFDAQNGYAIGPDTLLRTVDGGVTWTSRPIGPGHNYTSISCSDPKTCLLTTSKGDVLLGTSDAGETATPITASSQAMYGVAFASPTRVVAVGSGGATVVSDDGGANYTPNSTDIGGTFYALYPGIGTALYATGAKGQLATSADAGLTWRTLPVPTSQGVVAVAFPATQTGYALDESGALFKSGNGGVTWQTLDTGSTSTATGLVTPDANSVVLAGPRGVRRAGASGIFAAVPGKALRKASLDAADAHGRVVVAYGHGTKNIFVSANLGKTWKALKMPAKKVRVGYASDAVDFPTAKVGYMVDTSGRIWKTVNGGKRWSELASIGTGEIQGIAFANPSQGYIAIGSLGPSEGGFVMRTSDGGKTWHPQMIGGGQVVDVLAASGLQAYALLGDGSSSSGRSFFLTTTGGDAGSSSSMRLHTPKAVFKAAALKKVKGRVVVTGTLTGAAGGEQIVVSRREARGGRWAEQVVTAGANGGSFTTSWKIKRTSLFTAHWAGDSGRAGAGSTVLTITVKK